MEWCIEELKKMIAAQQQLLMPPELKQRAEILEWK